MARERMVTRTVEVSNITVMVVDTTTAEVTNRSYTLTGITTEDQAKILAKLKKQHETETVKLVSILTVAKQSILYGMPESEFIEHAFPMPPRAIAE